MDIRQETHIIGVWKTIQGFTFMQVDNQCCSFESIFIFYVHLIEDMDQTELCDI